MALLRAVRECAATVGVSFHVGSQCLDPLAWRAALSLTGSVVARAGGCPVPATGGAAGHATAASAGPDLGRADPTIKLRT